MNIPLPAFAVAPDIQVLATQFGDQFATARSSA
jgi:hypothetical protein